MVATAGYFLLQEDADNPCWDALPAQLPNLIVAVHALLLFRKCDIN